MLFRDEVGVEICEVNVGRELELAAAVKSWTATADGCHRRQKWLAAVGA